jgi:copper resistance protein B
VLLGARNDSGGGPSRQWAAIGVQGWRRTVRAVGHAYAGSQGRTAARVEADYDVLLSNRLILQPRIEAWWHGRDDPATRTGAGLGSAEAGLRLRYEITRQLRPTWAWSTNAASAAAPTMRGPTAKARATRWVAGLRIWF